MLEFKMEGMNKVIASLRTYSKEFPDKVATALYQESQIEMTESKRRCPWDTGFLRSTGNVQRPERSGRTIYVRLTYGTEYAIFVHEDPDPIHKPGTQWKYLESVLMESAPHMGARVARRMKANARIKS